MAILECVAYLFYPTLLGILFNLAAEHLPEAFGVVYYLWPVLLFAGWFWAGSRYARHVRNPVLAILVGNSVGILSLGIYLWQEYLAAERINWLQQLAQDFSASLNLLTVGIIVQFSPQVDGVIQVSNTALQCTGFILVVLAFSGGYFHGRNKEKMSKEQPRRP